MNKKDIENIIEKLKDVDEEKRKKVEEYMKTGTEWMKRDGLRAFNRMSTVFSFNDQEKQRFYGLFLRNLFSHSHPPTRAFLILKNGLKNLIKPLH